MRKFFFDETKRNVTNEHTKPHVGAAPHHKKANRARKGGHLGCSSEYNFNEYKKHFNFTVNS